jgi:lipopolysaccharide export system protein LptA
VIRLCTGFVAGLLALADLRAQAPDKALTQDELLRQIESLTPSPGGAAARRNAVPASAGAPKAGPLFAEQRPEKTEKVDKKDKGPTEIVALEATFDQKAHIAIFIGEVVVTDPEFNVQCDKLTAFLKHDEVPAGQAAPPPRLKAAATPDPKADNKTEAPKKPKEGGLEKAIAEADPGKIVTVTQDKLEADGTTSHSIGHGKKCHYDAVTGDITLYGKPDVQQGINTCVATEEETIMILNRDGHMRVTGAHKTMIKDQSTLNSSK